MNLRPDAAMMNKARPHNEARPRAGSTAVSQIQEAKTQPQLAPCLIRVTSIRTWLVRFGSLSCLFFHALKRTFGNYTCVFRFTCQRMEISGINKYIYIMYDMSIAYSIHLNFELTSEVV